MSFTLPEQDFLQPVTGDRDIAALFSADADLKAMLAFESALAAAQARLGFIPQASADAVATLTAGFTMIDGQFDADLARDALVVPGLIAALRQRLPEAMRKHLHFGSTSQDVIDTSLMIRSRRAFAIIAERLGQLRAMLDRLTDEFGARPLEGRTRMQRALPVKVSDRLGLWRQAVEEAEVAVQSLTFPVQVGGPVGTNVSYGSKAGQLTEAVAERLGLSTQRHVWHAVRGPVMRIAEASSTISGALGKIGIDIALMAQNELAEVRLKGGGTSSAMPHKQNPVRAELLVSLARFNATLLSGPHHAQVHEQERSGAAWTLEFMVLPQMIVTAGASCRIGLELLGQVDTIGGQESGNHHANTSIACKD
jgi:3-carboxy-cis,cis-muconate cycloisomerase